MKEIILRAIEESAGLPGLEYIADAIVTALEAANYAPWTGIGGPGEYRESAGR